VSDEKGIIVHSFILGKSSKTIISFLAVDENRDQQLPAKEYFYL
jgi:hypothetical protein